MSPSRSESSRREAASSTDVDVAILGAGPTGALAAKLCGIHGLTAVAFDRGADVYDLPRAVGLWDDVQRILASAGVLERILPATRMQSGAEFVDARGRRIVGIEIPPGFVTPNGHPTVVTFHQPQFERALRASLADHADVRLHTSHEMIAVEQSDERVVLHVRDLESSRSRRVTAKWLLGCDGASSAVRKSCGIAWHNIGYDQDWLVVDVRLADHVELSPYMRQVCDPARPTTMIPLPLGMHRWEFQLRPGETKAEMERADRVDELLAPWVRQGEFEVVRAVVYRFHAMIADTFRCGRVFLAGDAAHQTPPFMGQGLSSGVRDVDNLVWKLAHVARGLAGDALLDTYTAERRPMTAAAVAHSVNTGKLIDAYSAMASGGAKPSPELEAYAYGGGAQLPQLSTGLLAEESSPWIGTLVPKCTVTSSERSGLLDEVVGSNWAIVGARDPRERMKPHEREFWERLGAVFVSVPEPDGPILGPLLAHPVLVVRPDRVVYGVSPDAVSLAGPGRHDDASRAHAVEQPESRARGGEIR